ncbi:MAG: hypothetical protein C0501_31635 [Isosphaera sp.]|nr:hypothetical protein [Isosphaera sp.]
MTARDVRDVILARLPALGSPGERFFPDPDTDRERAWELIAREYVEALRQFDRPTLERAFARVRDTNTTGFWPSPGRFRQAALSLLDPAPDADAAKRRAAEQRAEAYVSRYLKTSRLYREARKDGWAGELLAYVQAAASVQAQVIEGTRGMSWDPALLDPASDAEPKEQLDAFVADCRRQKLAEVRIAVPRGRIAAWRAAATRRPAPSSEETPWQEVIARLTAAAKRGGGPG